MINDFSPALFVHGILLFLSTSLMSHNISQPHWLSHPSLAGLSWTDPDIFSLMLCQSLLGTYDRKSLATQFSAAPLASNIAKMNYVHLMQPFCTCYNDTGLFGVYMVTPMKDKEMVMELFHHVQEEMVSMTTGVSDEDLERAKRQLKYNMLQQVDGTSQNAEEIGRQVNSSSHMLMHRVMLLHYFPFPAFWLQMLTYGRRISLAETFSRVDAIDSEDVQRVAEKVIWDQEVAFAAIGPNLKYVGDLNALRRGTFWNRM